MKRFLTRVLLLAEKDVRIELRTKEALLSTLLFVLLALFIFQFAFRGPGISPANLAAGVLWVVIAFAGSIAFSYLSQRDSEDGLLQGLLLTGTSAAEFFFAKFILALLFLVLIEALTLPLFMLFFNLSPGDWIPALLMVLNLGMIGYAALGTILSSLLEQARLRNLLLPVVLYPLAIPLLIAGVKSTVTVLSGDFPREAWFLAWFDVIFLTSCALLYDFVLENRS